MNADTFRAEIMDPCLDWVLPIIGLTASKECRVFMLAIAGQESMLTHRRQLGVGPACGWWQFEQGTPASRGGVTGVFMHDASKAKLKTLCEACYVDFNPAAIWRAIEGHDALATGVARLLLWTYKTKLPGTQAEGWRQYNDLWRPGKPRPDEWPGNWSQASQAIARSAAGDTP